MKHSSSVRPWMSEDIAMLREVAARFFKEEIMPKMDQWREEGRIERSAWKRAGELGLLGSSLPPEFGGGGDKGFMAAVLLEQGRAGDAAWAFSVHNYVCHYILVYGSEEQKQKWLPRLGSGEAIAALAMSEPGAGSDLKAMSTIARPDGDHFVLEGQKTFISNGQNADLICVAAKTDPSAGARGISLILVEADMSGFRRGKALKKIGLHAADTSELFFDKVKVPRENVLGKEGEGFAQMMQQLPWERIAIAIRSVGLAEFAVGETIAYTKERKAFGGTLFDLQNTQFKLAEARTKLESMRHSMDAAVEQVRKDELDLAAAAMCKLHCAVTLNDIINECLQLHGGYGFMEEYPIARLYTDARAQEIYGGTNEIMKLLIARNIDL